MNKTEYRAVIKFFVKEGLTPNEIHPKFIKVYGNSPRIPRMFRYIRTYVYMQCVRVCMYVCMYMKPYITQQKYQQDAAL